MLNPSEIDDAQKRAMLGLPFVKEDCGHISFWQRAEFGHDATDLSLGTEYADMALRIAKDLDVPILITLILRDMVKTGTFGGVEAGFAAAIACAAKAGRMN